MFSYLMRVNKSEEAMEQIKELGEIVLESEFSNVLCVEATRDVLHDLRQIPGVVAVQPERTTGRLMPAL
jgi:hypothetical protein